jgi:hypothetical protein
MKSCFRRPAVTQNVENVVLTIWVDDCTIGRGFPVFGRFYMARLAALLNLWALLVQGFRLRSVLPRAPIDLAKPI